MTDDLTAEARPLDPLGAGAREVIRRLELDICRRLDGMLQGDYRGLVPGHGSEPGDTREYQPGDDVRRIDWNVTARMAGTHVRETIADRELETWMLIDRSASLDFGTANCEKRDLAIAAVAALGYLTGRAGNRIGAVLVPDDVVAGVPARSGRAHLRALLHRLVTSPRQGESEHVVDFADGLRRVGSLAHAA